MQQRFTLGMVSLLSCGVLACAADPEASAPKGAAQGASCAPQNLTQACSCGGLRGRQTCSGKGWSTCECRAPAKAGSQAMGAAGMGGGTMPNDPLGGDPMAAAGEDPPGNRSSVRFDWERTVPSGGSCEAGHYEGTFSGWYGPSIIVVADLKVIPVFPVDLPDSPGLAFDLTREGTGEIFSVSNGHMNGNALGAFPIAADIVGKLDCDTMKFDAMLVNGSYFIGPIEYNFEGPITADYDKQTHTFVNGLWDVMEPDYPGAGGGGDWTVHFIHP
jgi:hypothetical protein